MEDFIEGVRKHPCLWNPLRPDYREVHVKDQAWQRVVEHYNNSTIPNIQIAKIEWKKLRDNHRDALKRAKLGKNKLLPAQITTWKYAKAMQFLEPHMKYRVTEHIEMEPPVSKCPKYSDHDVSTTETSEGLESPSKRRCLERTSPIPKFQHEADALESFFNCMLQSTREMPQWMQTRVKKKIFAVIIEAEESLSSQDSNNDHIDQSIATDIVKIKTEIFTEDNPDYS